MSQGTHDLVVKAIKKKKADEERKRKSILGIFQKVYPFNPNSEAAFSRNDSASRNSK